MAKCASLGGVLCWLHHVLCCACASCGVLRLCSRPTCFSRRLLCVFRKKYWFPLNIREPVPILLGPGQESQPSVSGHDLSYPYSQQPSTFAGFDFRCGVPLNECFDEYPSVAALNYNSLCAVSLLRCYIVCVYFRARKSSFTDECVQLCARC